jgi:D-3-phosphoglycerate dehydrogenase
VGTQVARILTCFGCRILFYDPREIKTRKAWKRSRNLVDLIQKSDVIVLTASFQRPGEIISRSMIENLSGKFFINTSRGELIDENALFESIKAGKLRGVGIDVVRDENSTAALERWFDLAGLENLVLTPHIGGASLASLSACEQFLSEKLQKIIQ